MTARSTYAKFSATIAMGNKVGGYEVEIKPLLPFRVMKENFLFLSSNQGEKINVFMGEPQAAFTLVKGKMESP
ncbi:hypothetical protein GCM10010912_58170 [Paenibacillus albidus]|uniref:Uncharacterized protein n=1 Tax=Paenibacillus albidus TaxID=2041023 RepID=A0A917D3K9_9BACL|nr:hypothetical protein GCM10010912_58170 [Paenibacillus albidus]